jgi:hypothetical protein
MHVYGLYLSSLARCVAIRELFVAEGALPVLLDNLPVQKLSHRGR